MTNTKVYSTKKELKELTDKISEQGEKGFGIDAAVLTSMANQIYFSEDYMKKRKNLTKDLANAEISGRFDSSYIRIGIYLENEDPIVFEYKGPEAREIYNKLEKHSKKFE